MYGIYIRGQLYKGLKFKDYDTALLWFMHFEDTDGIEGEIRNIETQEIMICN